MLTRARWSFAASGTATGLISNGVSYFLLIYYSQVLGLAPARAGLVMMIALVVDAVSDPLVGRWSDRLRSRLGRRHPFLYAAVFPIALLYYLLWDPPSLSQNGLFIYLLGVALGLRLALTAHIVPFNALLPELSADYDERTRMMNYSYCAAWFFGTLMAVAMYAVWLADAPGTPEGSGVLRAAGYVEAGVFGAVVVGLCLVAAAWGTHAHIPSLASPPTRRTGGLRAMFETLNDRNFAVMIGSGLASSAAAGTSTALWAYMQPYFWGFNSSETSIILAAQLLSAVLAFVLIPGLVMGKEKKASLINLSWASLIVGSGPVFLELIGWFPVDADARFYLMVLIGVVQVMFIVMIGTVTASMIADIVEARAVVTRRREEGLLFSVLSFVGKVATGLGIWVSGLILAAVAFPMQADSGAVSAEVVAALGWLYAPVLAGFYLAGVIVLYFFDLSRQAHERNVRDWQGGNVEL